MVPPDKIYSAMVSGSSSKTLTIGASPSAVGIARFSTIPSVSPRLNTALVPSCANAPAGASGVPATPGIIKAGIFPSGSAVAFNTSKVSSTAVLGESVLSPIWLFSKEVMLGV